ncbi:hypothetical protein DFP72DRAFT_1067963 [Ephemerocybe angulata]|uniref:Uncharacterized protein n=1 Tax=Ephemerocybe angulata TaxID=980116 RepID=A0A8H6HYC4_9AGAR|nr:hypothetical protein DFP72DRAFT_1067963 [Tulosesus angulatus]
MAPQSPLIVPTSDPSEVELEPPPWLTDKPLPTTPTRPPRLVARSPVKYFSAWLAKDALSAPTLFTSLGTPTVFMSQSGSRKRSLQEMLNDTDTGDTPASSHQRQRGMSPETNRPLKESYPGQFNTPVESIYALGHRYTFAASEASPPPAAAEELMRSSSPEELVPAAQNATFANESQEPSLKQLESLLLALQERNAQLVNEANHQHVITAELLRVVRTMGSC